MTLLTYLHQRAHEDWLVGYNSQEVLTLVEQILLDLVNATPAGTALKVVLAERHPPRFLAYFIAACAANCHVFLANPDWGTVEWQQVFELVHPNLVLGQAIEGRRQGIGDREPKLAQSLLPSGSHSGLIMVPTGGSSGKIRFAMHTWETLMASVEGFRQYFECGPINSFCVLPLYHVSGLMQFLRSFISGGRLAVVPFKVVEAGQTGRVAIDPADFFLSLVPTQLQRLLERSDGISWLAQFHTVLLGGAPAWPALLEQARVCGIRLAPTYGMTETASQIATLKPDQFLQGQTGCGCILPHAQVTIHDSADGSLDHPQSGLITIQAASLALGYYPKCFDPDSSHFSHFSDRDTSQQQMRRFQPDDLGYFDAHGSLHIVGRGSDKIITGGENVFPAEVEAAIRATGLVSDVCVMGLSDRVWGEAVSAVYVPIHPGVSVAALQAALKSALCGFKRPKHWLAVEQLPRNAQGKIQRHQLAMWLKQALDCSSGAAIG